MSLLNNIFNPDGVTRSSQSVSAGSMAPFIVSGNSLSPDALVSADVALKNSDLYAVTSLISSDIAGAKFQGTGPYVDLLNQPSTDVAPYNFWQTFLLNLLLNGNAISIIKRDSKGLATGLINVPTSAVTIDLDDVTGVVTYKVSAFANVPGGSYKASDVIHARVTDNGYKKGDADKPKTDTPAIDKGQQADDTAKADVKVGDTVKVNFSASKWATGEDILQSVKGQSYKVVAVDGNKLLLDGVNSWINRKNAEIISTKDTVQFNGVYVVDQWFIYGGKWYARNEDMSIPVADYNNDIPVSAITLTDRYGKKLTNQVAQGNNGRVEYFTLDGHYKVLERSGSSIKVLVDSEPVWLQAEFAE